MTSQNMYIKNAALTSLEGIAPTDNNFIVGNGIKFVTESGATARTSLGVTIGSDVQAYDAGLGSLTDLAYVSDSFIKITATDTYAVRTIAETKTDLSLNLVENTALSTWGGSSNITTLGAVTATSYGGITESNLLDKSATESVTGQWDFVKINSTTAGDFVFERANSAAYIRLFRNDETTQNNDFAGYFQFLAKNNAGTPETITYSGFAAQVIDVSDGTEDGSLFFLTMSSGTYGNRISIVGPNVGINDDGPGEILDVGGNINVTGVYKVDDVQIVSSRVVDARCDGAINTGDATSDGVIDALRDAMITHGLIAAS